MSTAKQKYFLLELEILVGGPLDQLFALRASMTSSVAPFERSCRVTHAPMQVLVTSGIQILLEAFFFQVPKLLLRWRSVQRLTEGIRITYYD